MKELELNFSNDWQLEYEKENEFLLSHLVISLSKEYSTLEPLLEVYMINDTSCKNHNMSMLINIENIIMIYVSINCSEQEINECVCGQTKMLNYTY